jgi:chemotaxis family two-component system response regulator Rcp1
MGRTQKNRRCLLVVEDNPGDVRLVREAFSRRPDPPDIVDVPDGLAALEFLRGDAERPDLILLDLNLPRMDGREFLSVAKSDASLRRIPVVVLSSSSSEAEVTRLYDLMANGYLIKPADLEGLFELVDLIDTYWLRLSALPARNGRVARSANGSIADRSDSVRKDR